jgi:hypothetical protein
MINGTASVLKSGIVGYVYRWLRNAGIVAVAAGTGLLASDVYHTSLDGHAQATIVRLDIQCVLQGDGFLHQAIAIEIECGEADAERARYKIPLAVREATYAHLSFQSEIGATYEVRASLAGLNAEGAQRGEAIAITYSRSNPENIRAAASDRNTLKAARLLIGGLIALGLVLAMRWAAAWRGDVDAEVAELQEAHAATNTRFGAGHGRSPSAAHVAARRTVRRH